MRTRMVLLTVLVLAILALVAPNTLAAAKGGKGGGKGGGGGDGREAVAGVIIVNASPGGQEVLSADDGTVVAEVHCGGDLTHTADAGGNRYFVFVWETNPPFGHLFANTYKNALQPGCPGAWQLTDETDLPSNLDPLGPRWSPDGGRVAFIGSFLNDNVWTYELWVGEVVFVDGRPTSLSNVRSAVANPPSDTAIGLSGNPWSGDEVAYSQMPNGESKSDIFVANIVTGEVTNVTNSPATHEEYPSFSPVADQIAFVRVDGLYVLDRATGEETKVTTKKSTKATQIIQLTWSPDGEHLAFAGESSSGAAQRSIYRIKADGSGKAVDLTGSSSLSYSGPLWRTSP